MLPQDPEALSRNINYALQARQDRFLDRATHPGSMSVGGPMDSPDWDAFWGAMQHQEGVQPGGSLTANFASPGISGLHAAMARASQTRPTALPADDPLISTDDLIRQGRNYTGYKG